ncbi:sugar phosphate isomerase/epimerase family protein [Rubinisphaera margarita]|uniref:sugar phosphate isomerase/epimerase family protein n=1 Tax=Rubinisphaera margarita TaxID=2909586 RepID=UPI001EE952B8|nr:sugar phosphate isomerase/epimerase family protein [Rubinisphaera margarita]MCG6155207.1 sugar phosphate isomerase/epimerase [Rubinisphaera margarita]
MAEIWPIGVFTSIDAGFGVHLEVVSELKIPSIHVHTPHGNMRSEEQARDFLARCTDAGVTVTCVFCGFEGESYADIETTARTVGLVPEATRQERVLDARKIAEFARHLGCDTLGMHIGFVPEDRNSESYRDLLAVTQALLDELAEHGQKMHLETGQETASHLLQFFNDVNRDNLFINFDPANMILYGTGDPIEALKQVGPHVRSVHCKDAVWAPEDQRGTSWGREVALGQGDVDIKKYLETLKEIGYKGPLTIERELSSDRLQQKKDVGQAVELLEATRAELWGEQA